MFFINFSLIWSFTFFFSIFYSLILFSIIFYTLPLTHEVINCSKLKKKNNFFFLRGADLYLLFFSFVFFFFINNFFWCGPSLTSWFGNLIFSKFQSKIIYLIIFLFNLILIVYYTSFYFTSKQIYDFVVISFNFFYWILLLFTTNNIFTFIFFIEVLSTLIFLLLIVSTFSSTLFYNNLDLNLHNYFNSSLPSFYLQTLLYFFWISLVTSLNLFFSIILFYLKFFTFDWFILEHLLHFILNSCERKNLFFIFFLWFNFLFSIFLKCGLVPFFFWKPVFFKGLALHVLFFYIFFFYFLLFIFFIFFFLFYFHEFFVFFAFVNVLLLLLGFLVLLFVLCESYYIKSFLALSSILNTLFVFLALNCSHLETYVFF